MYMEDRKVSVHLQNVQQTLLLPLWARAQASRMRFPVIRDSEAVRIIDTLDYDFSALESGLGRLAVSYLAVRAREFDKRIRRFIRIHPKGTIVNVGAGLDTTFYRVDNNLIQWYNLDLPEVIGLRRKLLPRRPNMQEISKSLLDESFLEDIEEPQDSILFVAGGVLMYFDEANVRSFLKKVSRRFPGGEMVFDTVAPIALPLFNRIIRRTGMRNAAIRWGIRDAGRLRGWDVGVQSAHQAPLYSETPVFSFGLGAGCGLRLLDACSILRIVHLTFAGNPQT